MRNKYIVALVGVFVFSFSVFGQSPAKIEQELTQHLENIEKWTMLNDRTGEDLSVALAKEHKIFRSKLLKYTKRLSTLKYGYKDLAKHMRIATSPDGRFRIYSRDTLTGGTMHFFETVYQFQAKNGRVYSQLSDKEEGDAGAFVLGISQLDTKIGRVYMASSQAILSTSYRGQSLNLFRIGSRSLNSGLKLIKTKSGLTNSLGFAYDFFSVSDRKERPVRLFRFDGESRTIRFPVVIENEKFPQGEVTSRWIKYRFDGNYFVKVKS
ncbi:MAG: hypothetical protein HKN25_08635 [Pyrinomonadaceae bacterium]|nr:hypothetical protein [Pyrinomonadaceae bacterium]